MNKKNTDVNKSHENGITEDLNGQSTPNANIV
jgi:hypothetical protein